MTVRRKNVIQLQFKGNLRMHQILSLLTHSSLICWLLADADDVEYNACLLWQCQNDIPTKCLKLQKLSIISISSYCYLFISINKKINEQLILIKLQFKSVVFL
jgi:hypothetical protein